MKKKIKVGTGSEETDERIGCKCEVKVCEERGKVN